MIPMTTAAKKAIKSQSTFLLNEDAVPLFESTGWIGEWSGSEWNLLYFPCRRSTDWSVLRRPFHNYKVIRFIGWANLEGYTQTKDHDRPGARPGWRPLLTFTKEY
jgi:hypothetical protein